MDRQIVAFLRLRKICNYDRHTGLDMFPEENNTKSKVACGWISEEHKMKRKGPSLF